LRWSKNLGLLNSGFDDVNSVWLTSMNQAGEDDIEISGYAIYKDRIPQIADLFESATLLNVTEEIIRDQEVYDFRYIVRDFFDDENIYTPESVQGIEDLIQQ
jgi:hypothetical protein